MKENNDIISAARGGNKKLLIISIIISVICVLSIAAIVFFSVKYPHTERIKEIDGTRFTSLFNDGTEEWFYTTEKNIVRLNENNDVIESFDIYEYAKEEGLKIGKLRGSYSNPESDYVFIVATQEGDNNNGYILKLQNDADGKFNVEEYVEFNGFYVAMTEKDGDFFLLVMPDSFTMIYKYDADNLSEGVQSKGELYQAWNDGGTVELTKASLSSILSLDVVEGNIFIVHAGGIIMASVNFENNGYRYAYDTVYREEAIDIYGDDEDAISQYVMQKMEDELGVIEYNENTGDIKVKEEAFDATKYGYFIGDKLCGGAYVGSQDKFYLLSTDRKIYYYDRADLQYAGELGVYLELEAVKGITLAAYPSASVRALLYNRYTERGYVIYDSKSEISCLHFGNGSVSMEFTIDAEFSLGQIEQNGDNIYYFYYNRYETKEAGQAILSVANVNELQRVPLFKTLITTFAIIAVITLFVCFILWRAYTNKKFKDKTVKLLKTIARCKWIYITMIPSFILLISFCYYPAIASIRLSFFEYSTSVPTMRWNNFENYINVFTNSYTAEMFSNMALFLVYDIVIALIPPVIFAFFLTVMRKRGYSAFVRTMLFVPGVIPGMAGLLLWKEGIFNNNGGVLNLLLSLFTDTPHLFLTSSVTTKFELLIMGFPFVGSYLIFYGGMMHISDSFYEAAEIEGIGIWKRLFYIDIPLIMPQLKYIFILTFIHSVQNFMRVDVLTNGLQGTMIPIKMIYDKINLSGAYGEASAYATLMFVFLFFATAMSLRRRKDEVEM